MEKEYYIVIGGEKIPVSKEIYYEFKRPVWRERKRQTRHKYDPSVEALSESGREIASMGDPVDKIVEDKFVLDILLSALAELTSEEQNLIDALYYKSKTEREIADELGMSHQAINKRKSQILKKLKKLI